MRKSRESMSGGVDLSTIMMSHSGDTCPSAVMISPRPVASAFRGRYLATKSRTMSSRLAPFPPRWFTTAVSSNSARMRLATEAMIVPNLSEVTGQG